MRSFFIIIFAFVVLAAIIQFRVEMDTVVDNYNYIKSWSLIKKIRVDSLEDRLKTLESHKGN